MMPSDRCSSRKPNTSHTRSTAPTAKQVLTGGRSQSLLGADHDKSPYTQTGERITRIAAGRVRLVIDELRTDVTKTGYRSARYRAALGGPGRPPESVAAQ